MALVSHHKHLSLELLIDEASPTSDQDEGRKPAGSRGSASRTLSRARRLRSSADVLVAMEEGQRRPEPGLRVDGRPAIVRLCADGLIVEWAAGRRRLWPSAPPSSETIPFAEMLAVQRGQPPPAALAPSRLPSCLLSCLPCLRGRTPRVEVLTFRRLPACRCEWAPRTLVLEAGSESAAEDWAAAIGAGIEAAAVGRPKSLLVLLNPNAGARQGRRVWQRVAPLFKAAGIRLTVRETKRPSHAHVMAAGLTATELRAIDGIVCVGGDGIFHETFNGVLEARAAAAASTDPGAAELAALLGGLRLAHIPAGSTDAVACTLHGSRSPFTAAMHVCLGDSCLLDVLRVDAASATKFASCIAAYGFLADVTSAAESYRFLGPVRYDLVGAAKLLASRAYPARIRYLEGEVGRALRKHGSTVCGAGCSVCRAASFLHARRMSEAQLAQTNGSASSAPGSPKAQGSHAGQGSPAAAAAAAPAAAAAAAAAGGLSGLPAAPSSASLSSSMVRSEPPSPAAHSMATSASLGAASPHFLLPAAEAAERQGGEKWRELEGEFCSIMCIVMPCRSDKTKQGMVRYGHLCDGRLKLVLVSKCSPLQYLRFLLHMSRHGCAPGALKHVTVLDAVAVQVEPLGAAGLPAIGERPQQSGKLSCWNLDGELLRRPDQSIAAEVHPGLLRVFSRGVEQ